MTKFPGILLIMLMSTLCRAQSADLKWAVSLDVFPNIGQRSMSVDHNGNVCLTGYFEGNITLSSGSNNFPLSSVGGIDIFILKTDPSGIILWAKSIGSTLPDYGYSIATDKYGNVYTAGYFQDKADFDPGVGIYELTSTGLFDIFIQKMDSSGNFLWARSAGGQDNEIAYSIAVDNMENVITTGWFVGFTDLEPGPGTSLFNSNGIADAYIQKLDSAGNFLWAKTFGGPASDEPFSIATDSNGHIYTTGWFYESLDFDPGLGNHTLTSLGGTDIFIQKLDTDGNFLWAKSMGGNGSDYGNSIAVDHLGNIYSTGYFNDTADFDPGTGAESFSSNGLTDIYIQKLDSQGNFLWAKAMGGPGSDYGNSIASDKTGNVYVTGFFRNEVDFDPETDTSYLTSKGIWDIYIQKLDTAGKLLWAKSIGGVENDKGYAIAIDQVNNIYVTGIFEGKVDFDPGPGSHFLTGIFSGFLMKLNNITVDIIENNFSGHISAYPNPSSGKISINLGRPYSDITLKIMDIHGNPVYDAFYQSADVISVNLDQPEGMYFLTLITGQNKVVFKVFLR